MKKKLPWVLAGLAALAACLCVTAFGLAAQTPQAGDPWPDLELSRPAPAAEARYLGLKPEQGSFRLGEVKAQAVLVEVFSMYCPICQVEAPKVNQLFALIKQRGLGEKLKLLALGAGNSEMEVEVFRSKFNVPFAMVADAGFAAHKLVGEPRTPMFLLVRLEPGGAKVVHAKLGQIGDPEELLAVLQEKAGIK